MYVLTRMEMKEEEEGTEGDNGGRWVEFLYRSPKQLWLILRCGNYYHTVIWSYDLLATFVI